MTAAERLITENLEIWSSAIQAKSSAGRGGSIKLELYGNKKLRELILELAVRGLLVPQDPSDEPANELLKNIAAKKAKFLKEGKIKKQKSLLPISEDEKPFALPEGWEWVRLQDISQYIQRGKGPKYSDYGAVRVISQKCIQWSGFNIDVARYVDDSSLDKYQEERFLKDNDLLWNSTGTGTVGRVNLITDIEPHTLVADSHVTVIRTLLENAGFICSYISSVGIQKRIEPSNDNPLVSGTTNQVELNTSAVVNLPVPFPPLPEQYRIVTKVDELMVLCDQLEQQQETSITAHQALVQTLLGALTTVSEHDGFTAAWARIADNSDTLFTTEWSIDQLEQTILQLAVMGKLVAQNVDAEPALEVYSKIIDLPDDYARSNKQKIKGKNFLQIEDMPAIPESWGYFSIDDLYKSNHILDYADGNHGSLYPRASDFGNDGVLFLTAAQIDKSGEIDWDKCPRLRFDYAQKLTKGWSQEGDVFFTHNATVGRTAMATQVPDESFLLGTSVTFYRINNSTIHPRYLYRYFSSPAWYRQAAAVMQQTTRNQVSITKQALFYIALPPLEEQQRIAAKVDELIAICGTLKMRINTAQSTQFQLADALADQAVL